jgi:DNA-binding MarR family transcriptional regulator
VTSATVTGLLDTLEARGLARRLRNPKDRRSVLIEITREGRRLLDQLVPELIVWEKQWSQGLVGRRREDCLRMLGALQDQLRSSAAIEATA